MSLDVSEKGLCVFEQVDICTQLVSVGVKQENIAILSPYNAQVAQIKEKLRRQLNGITVTTITKSQGDTLTVNHSCLHVYNILSLSDYLNNAN